jgi:hypothetical protein
VVGKFDSSTAIWVFVSAILFLYGIIIFCAGLYYLFVSPSHEALAYLHPSLWWGALMMLFGAVFYFFICRRK